METKTIEIPRPVIERDGRLLTATVGELKIELELAFTAEEALHTAIMMASKPHQVANILQNLGIKGIVRCNGKEREINKSPND